MITGFVLTAFYNLFVGKIPKDNIYSVKINMSPLSGALFNSKNLHYPTLIKIRMFKLIIKKANKSCALRSDSMQWKERFKEPPSMVYSYLF